jgi:hypothetical protein
VIQIHDDFFNCLEAATNPAEFGSDVIVQRAKTLFDAAAASFALHLGSDHENTRDAIHGSEQVVLWETQTTAQEDTFIPGQLRY